MPEGSQTSLPPAEATPPSPESTENPEDGEQKPQTVAETEAIWRHRVSQKDRAHEAEKAALRSELDTAKAKVRALETAAIGTQGSPGEAEALRSKVTELESRLVTEQQTRVTETRAARYPFAAEVLGPEQLASMDEGKLAGLNARLNDGDGEPPPAPSPMDPNSAPRPSATPPTPPQAKSVEELKAELERQSPEFLSSIRGG